MTFYNSYYNYNRLKKMLNKMYYLTCSTFTSFTMYSGYIVCIAFQPIVHIFAENFNLFKIWWIMVLKWEYCNSLLN